MKEDCKVTKMVIKKLTILSRLKAVSLDAMLHELDKWPHDCNFDSHQQ